MSYTIVTASFANEDNTAAVIMTAEAGAVLVSETDTPDLWPDVIAFKPAAFVPPAPSPAVDPVEQFKALLNDPKVKSYLGL